MEALPLRQRRIDYAVLGYFLFNLIFITYFFDLEQIVIPDASHFSYPVWPPRFLVNLSHWWGRTYDQLLFARPVFWRATIWIDAIFFGPYYAFAVYAFIRGRKWIRIPTVIYSSVMITNVTIILSEEIWGVHASNHLAIVVATNAAWVLFPLYLIFRMWRSPHPFAANEGRSVAGLEEPSEKTARVRRTDNGVAGTAAVFRERYGPWAVVAGASQGIGEAFSRGIAARGVNLVMVARRAELLSRTAESIAARYGVATQTVAADLGTEEGVARVLEMGRELDAGLLVYNAAKAVQGRFLGVSVPELDATLSVNCRAPLHLVHDFGGRFAKRGRGGIILMSSLAGLQGSPFIAPYSATKAFGVTLAEALWYELRGAGVDVLACVAGATATPGYVASMPKEGGPVSAMSPERVASGALARLGRGPLYVPGAVNKAGAFLMRRLLSRRAAIGIMGRADATFAEDERSLTTP